MKCLRIEHACLVIVEPDRILPDCVIAVEDGRIAALGPAQEFPVSPGEIVLIMGPSGSGKTTLLSMLGVLLKPTEGAI